MKIERYTEGLSLKRSVDSGTAEQRKTVQDIIENVRQNGDAALYQYTEKFDGVKLSGLVVSKEEMDAAVASLSDEKLAIIQEAADNIRMFHEKQLRNSWITTDETGTMLGQKITPLDAVGVYVPGGTAAYPSSVLMNVMPAKAAGVKRIVMVSPPGKDGKFTRCCISSSENCWCY